MGVLTNGISWEIYRIRFEKPINYDLICSFNFLELKSRKADDQEKLFLLCKKGISGGRRDEFYERVQSVNRFTIGAIVLSDTIISVIKRELRKLSSGLKIDNSEIERILHSEVLKREVIEGKAALKAKSRVKKISGRSTKKPKVSEA